MNSRLELNCDRLSVAAAPVRVVVPAMVSRALATYGSVRSMAEIAAVLEKKADAGELPTMLTETNSDDPRPMVLNVMPEEALVAEVIDAVMQAYEDCGIRATVALDQPNVPELDKLPYLAELLPPALRRCC